jgi:hypothetical protein
MNTPRVFVKGLAIVAGIFGVAWALLGPLLLVSRMPGYFHSPGLEDESGQLAILVCMILLQAAMGALILRQIWIFWRLPDRRTATQVVGIASFVLGFSLYQLVTRYLLLKDAAGPLLGPFLGLGLIYLFYRHVLCRVVERAYPAATPEQSHA